MAKSGSRDVAGVELKKLRNKKLTSTEFMQVWFHYDKDKSGFLEYVEFSQFMKDLFLKGDCVDITPEQVEKYTAEVIHLMDTYDENRDGRFEMNELAKALKIEENYLNKIINKKSIKDKHVQSILKHYNSNVNDTIEGPELHAFVGDIARYLGLKLSLTVIEAGVTRVKENVGTDVIDTTAIKSLLSEGSIQQLKESFKC
ncbi:secretagogin-like isoform X2 [Bolinopsis microptera]|uniref:secretagogin-like isoform X2 n=1 Tax=Bolinopsis microptera TaxID=2820187 RepID=UPI0030798AD1